MWHGLLAKRSFSLGFVLLIVGLTGVGADVIAQQVASQAQLREIQKKIEALADDIGERVRDRDALTAELGDIEKQMAAARKRQGEIRLEVMAAEAEQRRIASEQQEQESLLTGEQRELARQLRAAFTSGRQERLKLMLNQQSPEALGRTLTYYRYLNGARMQNMDAVNTALSRLVVLAESAAENTARLERLATETAELIKTLDRDRGERQRLVAAIESRLRDEQGVMASLQQQEGELKSLIDDLSAILDEYPTHSEAPLTQMRGNLTWPVAGRLRSSFGSNLAGGRVKSKGVELAAPSGTEVRSIYHGRVVFADWLPGMGLLMIVDHGEELLSLYGYNETLQKSVGDWIAPGDVIATVGNSGGRGESALYFEMRRGKRAVNPAPWFQRRPGPRQR